ncbi:7088_t:CDS:2 [Rhizophagus irregularis]|nr:7088_t:CDS:2 [Rhizophagus irregularis]
MVYRIFAGDHDGVQDTSNEQGTLNPLLMKLRSKMFDAQQELLFDVFVVKKMGKLRSSCLTCDEEYYLMYFFLLSCVVKEDGKIYELMDIVYMDNIYFDGGTLNSFIDEVEIKSVRRGLLFDVFAVKGDGEAREDREIYELMDNDLFIFGHVVWKERQIPY